MGDSIRLKSFNTNGLGQEDKRVAIFQKMKKLNCIILLQETHSSPYIENKWKKEWGSEMIFSHGSSKSKGVCILFPQTLEFEILETVKDTEGRLLIVKVKIENKIYIVVNVYAPTRDSKMEQLAFIKTVKEQMIKYENESFLAGGDFNFYMSKLDRIDSMSHKNDNPEYRKEIVSLMTSLNLVDAYRVLNPEKRRYTWHARGKASRLDYWFISEHLLNEINNCDIDQECLCDFKDFKDSLFYRRQTLSRQLFSLILEVNKV